MLPNAKQLYATFAAVGREAFITSGALPLSWGQDFLTLRIAMPVAPLNLNVCFTDDKVDRIDFQEHLRCEFETVPLS